MMGFTHRAEGLTIVGTKDHTAVSGSGGLEGSNDLNYRNDSAVLF